ncbi:PQQ-binding-like beta-propeller repeat protein [Halovulum dunhuangense]|uniref:PQQ-binding-like beta-propeller repeat protein n=1 Tax=Halovulum dunhuangense TaxID=1505036 RepID=A0A849L731_9RHOB|nr:PQQ-binding-like beta-propeller repeat protein [Halovulum dunhuangense]NNU81877.1 PQQ-binding-like beta-propeller repeat protein [Halovulum dunhuangense]
MADSRRRFRPGLVALAAAAFLAACSEREPILPGEREPVRPDATAEAPETLPALRIPPAQVNTDWGHLNGSTEHLAPSVALSASPALRWSVPIGEGDARRQRLISAPVVAGGAVYTLDAGGNVTAVATDGQVRWRASLAPAGEQPGEGFGGGIAAADGALVVTTGFGEALRLDPVTGGVQWRTRLEGTVRAAPVLGDGIAVVMARNNLGYGLNLDSGEIVWRLEGVGRGAGTIGAASPALRGPVAVMPFVTGEVRAVLARSGLTVWTAALTGGRRDLVRSIISDISGDPVIDFDIVYVGNQGGRMVALDRRSGERLWTLDEGSYSPALPVDGSVFVVSDAAELLRLNAADGTVLWRTGLPEWERPDRRRDAIPHFGPLLAGGRLVVASGDGLLRFFDPATGADLGAVQIPGGAAAQPAIAGGVLYVVSRDGRLHAFQ